MAQRPKHLIKRDKLLAKVPQGATRIKVKDEKGVDRYRDLDEIYDTDTIQINKQGIPIVMMAKPGRKLKDGKVELKPANDTIAEILKQKTHQLNDDPLVTVSRNDPESDDVLKYAIQALAEEVSSIGFERREAERLGTETSNISTRRVNALKTMVDTWLKRRDQVATKEIDLRSASARALFQCIFEMFDDAMESVGIGSETSETIFSKVAKRIDDEHWETEARNRMKNAR